MVIKKGYKVFSVFKHLLRKSLIILSLLVLTCCNQSAPKPTLTEQTPGEVDVYAKTGIIPSVITDSTEVFEHSTPSEVEDNNKLAIDETTQIDYGQVKISNRFSEDFFLTYDKSKWELGGEGWLKSILAPRCSITQFGEQDGGGGWQDKFTSETIHKTIDGVEFQVDQMILLATSIPEWSYVVFDTQGNTNTKALNFYTGPENYEECLAAFWEIMEISRANNFSEVLGLAP